MTATMERSPFPQLAPPTQPPVRPRAKAARKPKARFRYEIQALRAVAVLLVVAGHMYPGSILAGGYIGVDVFFVISGFLITAHLWREVSSTNRIDIVGFYRRRLRRLMPAYLVVLVFCVVMSWWLLPRSMAMENLQHIMASALQVENWWLARQSTDYFASNNAATSVQHFWSLAVEEQFYFVWPFAILAGWFGARTLNLVSRKGTIIGVLTTITLVSFAFSFWYTNQDQGVAYFITPTRMWELGVGGILALLGNQIQLSTPVRVLMRWFGLGLIVWATLTFDATTVFPGYAALVPVLGAAAVLIAGDTGGGDPLTAIAKSPPVQWVGNTSYSMYLWHWPILIFTPFVIGEQLRSWQLLVLLPVIFVASEVSYRFVEPFLQAKNRLPIKPHRVFTRITGGVLVTVLFVATTFGARWYLTSHSSELDEMGPCYGAAAIFNPSCTDPYARRDAEYVKELDFSFYNESDPCVVVENFGPRADFLRCTYTDQPKKTVAVIGDSHAEHYREAIKALGRKHGWNALDLINPGCTFGDPGATRIDKKVQEDPKRCTKWTKWVLNHLKDNPVDAFVISSHSSNVDFEDPAGAPAAIAAALNSLPKKPIIIIRDAPQLGAAVGDINICMATHKDPLKCASPRSEALKPDLNVVAAKSVPNARVIDLTDAYCDADTCYEIVGGLRVHFDYHHLTRRFAKSLAPYLEPTFVSALNE